MALKENSPIGVFDSGIGGITVLRELAARFPKENFIYLGDTARLPYGTKSPETIRKYGEQNLNFLIEKGVKAVAIACNSASTQIPEDSYRNIPVFNVIRPGAQMALQVSIDQRIGILGTRATVLSEAYQKAILRQAPNAFVIAEAAPLLVPLAEEGWIDDPVTNLIAYRYVQRLLQSRIDTLILGCTHYPLLKNSLLRAVGSSVTLVDSGAALAVHMSDFVAKNPNAGKHDKIQFYTTDASSNTEKLVKALMPNKEFDFLLADLC
jgi:glutamate racemase